LAEEAVGMASHKARKVVTAGNRLAGFAAVNILSALQVAAGVERADLYRFNARS
jgi:hypothetical protein